MTELQNVLPAQSNGDVLRKILKAVIAMTLSKPHLYGLFLRTGGDPAKYLAASNAKSSEQFVKWWRRRPNVALQRAIERSLNNFPRDRVERRIECAEHLNDLLDSSIRRTAFIQGSTHWLFGLNVDDPQRVIDAAGHTGFHVSQTPTKLRNIDASLPGAASVMQNVVFIPAYPEMPFEQRVRLAEVINEVARSQLREQIPVHIRQ